MNKFNKNLNVLKEIIDCYSYDIKEINLKKMTIRCFDIQDKQEIEMPIKKWAKMFKEEYENKKDSDIDCSYYNEVTNAMNYLIHYKRWWLF